MRICMLLHKGVANDTRVRREAGALAAAGHEVTVVHLPPAAEPQPSGLSYALVPATLGRGRERLPHAARLGVEAARLALRAASTRPDAVHAHDAAMLLPGMLAARRSGAKLVYDSHELATGVRRAGCRRGGCCGSACSVWSTTSSSGPATSCFSTLCRVSWRWRCSGGMRGPSSKSALSGSWWAR